MPDQAVTKKWPLLALVLILISAGLGYRFRLLEKPPSIEPPQTASPKVAEQQKSKMPEHGLATPPPAVTVVPIAEKVPDAITPESVNELIKKNTPFILVKADEPVRPGQSTGPIRTIYYSASPSYRAAQVRVNQDRHTDPNSKVPLVKPDSQRLTGTPVEWQRLKLPVQPNVTPEKFSKISPKQLSEAIKDSVDLQVIDLRPESPFPGDASPFPNALRWLPHEAIQNIPKLSKEKWVVLVGAGSEDARPIAFELFQKGYVLTAMLEGGYPAWANATDR